MEGGHPGGYVMTAQDVPRHDVLGAAIASSWSRIATPFDVASDAEDLRSPTGEVRFAGLLAGSAPPPSAVRGRVEVPICVLYAAASRSGTTTQHHRSMRPRREPSERRNRSQRARID